MNTQEGRYLPLNSGTNSTGYGFLDPSDITDSIAQQFINNNDPRVQTWLDNVDGEILALAQELDVPLTSISIPLHFKIQEYARDYYCYTCFKDTWALAYTNKGEKENTVKASFDKYESICARSRSLITYELFVYTNLSLVGSQVSSGIISLQRA